MKSSQESNSGETKKLTFDMSEERERRGETSDKKKKARDFHISMNYSNNKLSTPKSA